MRVKRPENLHSWDHNTDNIHAPERSQFGSLYAQPSLVRLVKTNHSILVYER